MDLERVSDSLEHRPALVRLRHHTSPDRLNCLTKGHAIERTLTPRLRAWPDTLDERQRPMAPQQPSVGAAGQRHPSPTDSMRIDTADRRLHQRPALVGRRRGGRAAAVSRVGRRPNGPVSRVGRRPNGRGEYTRGLSGHMRADASRRGRRWPVGSKLRWPSGCEMVHGGPIWANITEGAADDCWKLVGDGSIKRTARP